MDNWSASYATFRKGSSSMRLMEDVTNAKMTVTWITLSLLA